MKWLGTPKRARRREHPAPGLSDRDLRTAWQCVSLLLDYPSPELIDIIPAIRAELPSLPAGVAAPLDRFTAYASTTDPTELQRDYVATFDTTRKCALHLTYYAHGETRKRGIALVQFKQAYRRGGLEVTEDELPDHICVLCEFGATGDTQIAWKLMNDHRVGVELLHLALQDRGSAWVDVVAALRATLPKLDGTVTEAVERLLAEGPPNEEVGLDAYALDPRLNPHPDDDAASLQGALT